MSKVISLLITALILFSACATTGSSRAGNPDPALEAEQAAMAALAAMDGGGTTAPMADPPRGTAVSAQNPAGPRSRPLWVDTPDMVFGRPRYVSAVGYGSDRNLAERDALAKLTGVFGQSIQADLQVISSYSEAVRGGAIQVAENSSVQNAITTSAEMDSLVGAEIAEVWFDNVSVHYAVAVMETEKTSVLYADLIRSNDRIIADLTNMTAQQRNSLDGYSRLLLAATIADANRVYANVLTVVGDTRGINPAEMKRGDDFRIEAAEVVRNIPIGVNVTGDRGNRVQSAFSRAISDAGFRSGGSNSRYMLNVSYTMTPVDLPNQTNVFIRYQINGSLADTAAGNSVLFTYDANGREGHLSTAEAEERALRSAERKVADEFGTVLTSYLASLMSGRR